MATKVLREHHSQLTSDLLLQVNGFEFRAGGNPLVVQFFGPLDLGGLEGSMDKQNWRTVDDDQGTPIDTKGTGLAIVRVRRSPKWVRHFTENGAVGTHRAVIGIVKESR